MKPVMHAYQPHHFQPGNQSSPDGLLHPTNLLRHAVLLFVMGLAIVGLKASAQSSKGTLAGVVLDSSGASISHATLVITNQGTGESRTVTTGSAGEYRVDAINPGAYQVHVTSEGFSTVDVKDIAVAPSVVTTYNARLSVGKAVTSVSIEANGNTINTENAQLSGTVDTIELQKIPIFTLNPAELTSQFPGVTEEYTTVENLGGVGGNGGVKLVVNGARPRANNFLIDSQDDNDVGLGGEAVQPTQPEFFQSVSVLLNDATAEYGRGGGATINQITKAGTNHIHGSVYDIYNGSGIEALDGQTRRSKTYTAADRALKARFDSHEFGFTLGGPAIKDKLFGFGGADFFRYYGKSQATQVELPDAAGYAQLVAIAGAGNAQAQALLPYFNNGSYLTSNFSLVQAGYEQLGVSPRAGCTAGCNIETGIFQRLPVSTSAPTTQWTYRVDYTPRQTDTFSVHYLHTRSSLSPYFNLNPTTLVGFDSQNFGINEIGGGSWVHIFTPHLLNEFRASELRLNAQFAPTPDALANPASQLPNIIFNGTQIAELGISQNMPQGRKEDLYQLQDTVSWSRGRQTVRAGFDFGRLIETDLVPQNALGLLTFNSGVANGAGLSSLDNYLSNQLGASGSATKTFGPTRTDPHIWKLAGFVQDDLKLTPNFTVNLGLRYDYLTNPVNSLAYPSVDINNPFQAINTYLHAQDDKNNFGPRVGFAWVPRLGFFADGKTVIHGGVGVFYDVFFSNILVNAAQSSPVAPTGTLQSSAPGGYTGASGLLATITPTFSATSSVQSQVNNLVNPITYQYNAGFERELPFRIKADINYVGSRGEKLYSNRQLNYVVNPVTNARINTTRGIINVRDNRADSDYNSLQAQFERKFSNGLFFLASYTYSKLLDDSSEVFTTFASPTSYSADLTGGGLGQDWGNSAFDRRHLAVFTYSYTPKGFRSNKLVADKVLSALTRHITVSGQTQLYSGLYTGFNVSGKDINGDSSATNDRPVVSNLSAPITSVGVDGSYIGATTGTFYDYAAYNRTLSLPTAQRTRTVVMASAVHFLVPSPFAPNAVIGPALAPYEVRRNSFENPGQAYWNVALEKAFPMPFHHLEQSQLVFRAEAQQLGNHNNITYYTNNVTQVGQSAFQNPSTAREPNEQNLRFWAKYQF